MQQFHPLGIELGAAEKRYACDVPPRPAEARHKAGTDRVFTGYKYDRGSRRDGHQYLDRRVIANNDHRLMAKQISAVITSAISTRSNRPRRSQRGRGAGEFVVSVTNVAAMPRTSFPSMLPA